METIISLCCFDPRPVYQDENGSDHDSDSDPSILADIPESQTFESETSIPDIHESFSSFLIMNPKYKSTEKVDYLRSNEYSHLSDHVPKVCLDYCGFGLFSFLQTVHYWESCNFSLTEITVNLTNHVINGSAKKNTMEHDIKIRIMDYLNIPENEYELVFTVSRGSAFKLLAESYPFHKNKSLLTMFDHESQSVNQMARYAKEKGAKVQSSWFKWPNINLCSTDLRKKIARKTRKKKNTGTGTGLFVFPGQSRVTGVKYSYQWMSLAQQNNWDVLLDAGALGPKDMDSLGLSLFRPDFIITSFYRVFGFDPTGFGCLLIKKSAIGNLQTQPGHTGSGIVKISPIFPLYYLSDSFNGISGFAGLDDEKVPAEHAGPRFPAFSGVYTSDQVREVYNTEMDPDNHSVFEESGELSAEDMMKSPVFSEDGSFDDHPIWIDLGQSPMGSGSDKHNCSSSVQPPFWFTNKNKNKHFFSPKGSKIDLNSENAIRRETEGGFRLLGRRIDQGNKFLDPNIETDDFISENGSDTMQKSNRLEPEPEPEILCQHLDHIGMLGLNKTALRLRFLVNWLVTSLLRLRIRCNDEESEPLVHIYGPKIELERGGSVAFNVFGKNKRLVNPEIVQKLGETNGISLGIAILSHIRMQKEGSGFIRVEVVTASLGFLTDFSDVYRLWAFVAKFLNPGFIKGGLSTVVEDE